MAGLPLLLGPYEDARSFEASWRELGQRGRESVAGFSVEGRPIYAFEFGAEAAPSVLLTALIHGIEFIGSVALREVVRALLRDETRMRALLDSARFVVLPILNPDSLCHNTARLSRGLPAWRRGNANGVDLNRNFPRLPARLPLHPFAGSRFRASPHYIGPRAFSEPETRALHGVVAKARPLLSLGFHSFGNLLLFPWAFTKSPNPREAQYRKLGAAFNQALMRPKYSLRQARDFYPTVGDLDDWLDHEFGTLAFTVEVSSPDARLIHPRRSYNPFCWMNPTKVSETVENLVPGVLSLLASAGRHASA